MDQAEAIETITMMTTTGEAAGDAAGDAAGEAAGEAAGITVLLIEHPTTILLRHLRHLHRREPEHTPREGMGPREDAKSQL